MRKTIDETLKEFGEPNTIDELLTHVPIATELNFLEQNFSNDLSDLTIEMTKFAGLLSGYVAHILPPALFTGTLTKTNWSILIGLVHRISRLFRSTHTLLMNGDFGETITIINRSIYETSINIIWLCHKDDIEVFKSFMLEGLKTETLFANEIKSKINERNGMPMEIEESMLASITRLITDSNSSFEEVERIKSKPNMKQKMLDIGLESLDYVVWQKILSHEVHGTWPSLAMTYLRYEGEIWRPNQEYSKGDLTQINSTIYTSFEAIGAFLKWSNPLQFDLFANEFNFAKRQIIYLGELVKKFKSSTR